MTPINGLQTVTIIGVGLLGGSLGLGILRRQIADRVIGVGRDQQRLQQALHLSAVTEITTDLAAACRVSDLIILCTPVSNIIRDLPQVLAFCGPQAVVTDVGSVKGAICAAAQGDARFVGSHPMAGSEQTGVVAARATLFEEATWAITPIASTNRESVELVTDFAQTLGARTLTMPPQEHDQAVAITSHLPHAIATALMRVAARHNADLPKLPSLTAGSFNDGTRVAASSPELWRDIFSSNRPAIIDALISYKSELDIVLDALETGDEDLIEQFFAAGANAKRSWNRQD